MATMTASPIPPHLAANSASVQTTPRPSRARPSPQPSPAQSVPSPRQGSPRSSSPRGQPSGGLDLEAILRSNGGDAERALEQVVAERNTLQQQNSQLWKLIEKQRAQCTHLVQDNERLRSDRERANQRLVAGGLEPINGKRIPHSSSSVGLGLRADILPPSMKRNNSDRDERIVAQIGTASLQVPSADSSAPSSPLEAPASLLPSPMADNKLRRESRMAFAPEVRSFLSLAESPRAGSHQVPPVPHRSVSVPTPAPAMEITENNPSPGSAYSPSPAAGTKEESREVAEAPSSSKQLATMAEVDEEPAETAEVDLSSPISEGRDGASQPPARQSSLHRRAGGREEVPRGAADSARQAPLATPPIQSSEPRRSHDSQRGSEESTPRQSVDVRPSVESMASATSRPSRPLPRLSPALLSHTRLSIPHTTVYPNTSGRDVLCFIVAITVRPPNAAPVTWNVAKLFSAFIDVDTKIRAKSGKRSKDWKSMVAPLPEGKAWKDFAPSKIDQRKTALEAYLQSLLSAPLSDKSDLCEFLSTDPVQAKVFSNRKEGYLTKKAKSFGGWRTRYFVLDGSVLECYENRGGPHHSSIVITNAQIGRQNRASELAEDRESRHAFLIIEQSRKGPQRHILCAESDMERDSWIEALVKHVDPDSTPLIHVASPPPPAQIHLSAPPPPAPAPSQGHPSNGGPASGLNRQRSNSRKGSRDVTVTAAQPMASMPAGSSKFGGAPSPSMFNSMEHQRLANGNGAANGGGGSPSFPSSLASQPSSSGSTGSGFSHPPPPQRTEPPLHSSTSTPADPPLRPKRQSMIPSRSSASSHSSGPPPSHSAAYLSKLSADGLNAPPGLPSAGGPTADKDRERKAKSGRFWPSFGKGAPTSSDKIATKPVFGVPLSDSLAIASVASLPAIVFRCIEWLEAKRAEDEEGIYRLSGSSAVIKGLKDRFDVEGDVNLLLVDEHWDPHAVAGLLKGFLRELPTSLLTRELHPRFLAVMDLIDSSARVAELSRLVSELPPPNYALLRALTAHLILIVKHATTNKMTLRNIGIVFSPTLGIPAGIFSELVSHFGAIFDDEPEEEDPVVHISGAEDAGAMGDGPVGEDGAGLGGEETVGRKRNSMLYQQGGADAMLGLGGRALDPVDDSASEMSADEDPRSPDLESDNQSGFSSDNHSSVSHNATPRADRADPYPSAAAARRQKKDATDEAQQQAVYPQRGSSLGGG